MTALVRMAFGIALLAAPDPILRLASQKPATARVRVAARILGARELIQAVVTGVQPDAACLAVGAETDLVHAATMLALATVDSRTRRVALSSAMTAGMFAAVGAAHARRAPHTSPALAGNDPRLADLVALRHQAAASVARHTLPGAVRTALHLAAAESPRRLTAPSTRELSA